ncbi:MULTISPECIES: serine hydrolase domain-containing protein [Chryseobacterium]|uniref:CubicO group peptidase (Beta-lactamase class C family) n=1 Tax=Chryseobacterium camelliae TaxID=1265445 RepID=A0ABU0TNZ7_9FLAO|nr:MULTISPECIES: serine hydrolase domain-containing protein [Chryseobacterium]MDT3408099.1 CubicO group peptidase (beta-lactamase class C family) [Pseudacidovorax intermedius]MDQ1098045.1 CubicO group peptidase (beta-lactamase class C family) [Chryseobacterium camelliae]MDQ1101975.1 CubicO group peptidase (beta-lactamase class C family) [Chryseobacterium sp. SORGH_AS_1048]MDR6085413.1 CubicO group peptidase (beta-lactamase class C family) [Chryseobacterium sp. SORGH_AS_0909]MDR6129776.1 CubicO
MKNISLSFLLILCIFQQSFAQLNQKLDSIIQTEFSDPHAPGGVFLVSQKGKTLYEKAFGKANIELDFNMVSGNVFEIGSMTKQFTAIAVLILESQGKLSVNDPVSKYIPDYPSGNLITIHHLLTHTSGIKDFTKIKSLQYIAQKEMTPKQMVDFFKNETPDFKPGEKFEYNNAGYVILGYLIELVSGERYEDFIRKNIFEKAGMKNSYYASDRKIIRNRAYGYHQKTDGYVNKTIISFSVPFASGSLMSTVEDMVRWQHALNTGLILDAAHINKAFTAYTLNNGEKFTYGYGWHLKDINGIPSREHGGSIFGFKSMAVYVPSLDLYVIGFSNCDCHSPTQVVKDMAKAVVNAVKK